MVDFYIGFMFIGIVLAVFSLVLVFLDKRKTFNFTKNYDEKKQELIEIINDAEQMIEELNKFSDYIVTQMDFKNEELQMYIKKADNEIQELSRKVHGIYKTAECSIKQLFSESEAEARSVAAEVVSSKAVNGISREYQQVRAFDYQNEYQNNTNGINNFNNVQKEQPSRNEKVIPLNNRYNEVLRLAECGLDEVAIAKRLNIGKGEIRLILDLNRN